jgi:hypothetical protein
LPGALAPSVRAGTITGPAKAIPAAQAAELFKNCLRVSAFAFLFFLLCNDLLSILLKRSPIKFGLPLLVCGIIIPKAASTRNLNLLASERRLFYP